MPAKAGGMSKGKRRLLGGEPGAEVEAPTTADAMPEEEDDEIEGCSTCGECAYDCQMKLYQIAIDPICEASTPFCKSKPDAFQPLGDFPKSPAGEECASCSCCENNACPDLSALGAGSGLTPFTALMQQGRRASGGMGRTMAATPPPTPPPTEKQCFDTGCTDMTKATEGDEMIKCHSCCASCEYFCKKSFDVFFADEENGACMKAVQMCHIETAGEAITNVTDAVTDATEGATDAVSSGLGRGKGKFGGLRL